MERTLFDWESWEDFGESNLEFYDCTLKVAIGPHAVGSVVPAIYVGFGDGLLITRDEMGNETYKAKLSLKIS